MKLLEQEQEESAENQGDARLKHPVVAPSQAAGLPRRRRMTQLLPQAAQTYEYDTTADQTCRLTMPKYRLHNQLSLPLLQSRNRQPVC